ncbi:MAG: ornithine cyclodeaminase family protein [Candidatus Caldarchaeum sp.]|nr:ornithine cyclodeaminase family protein [Candidatus Caldarchaeum sp.]MCX8201223.1 ornithine cyclodeaminase family protein [Candidatus Caldarchaeum sp.]MDW8435469.1 ornithine cyclodeaminase family protein [Candidatus Caldarchaeum sp.]
MVLVLTKTDLENWLSMEKSVEIVEAFFRDYEDEKYAAPPRMVTSIPEKDAVWLNMPAHSLHHSGFIVKLINEYRRNPVVHGLDTANGVVLFFDLETGAVKGLLDAVSLTALRTGGIGGVGAKYLAPKKVLTVGMIGSGRTAWTQLTALIAVRRIEKLRVYSPTKPNRQKFAEKAVKTLGLDAEAVDTPMEAVEKSDVVVTATNSSEPALSGRWLGPDVHVTSIGALPTRRELDVETFRRAELIVADLKKAVLKEAGDIMAAVEHGVIDASEVLELHEVVKKGVTRPSRQTVTLLKSVGFAALDLFFTAEVLKRAEKEGVGREVEL